MTVPTTAKPNDIFQAATAGERAARVREWLQGNPGHDALTDMFKELSVKDKGAAKLVREKLDELRRAKNQEAVAGEWAAKAQSLLEAAKLNIADAMAWQRDAAKAGAPLSKEPLSSLKSQLADRVRAIEDLQHQVQVQREAAVLLAQRIEVLSTKSWKDAQSAGDALKADVEHWQVQAGTLLQQPSWASVDVKFPPLLEASRAQLLVVWDAFQAAVAQATAAAEDASAPLPPVLVWADELRVARGVAVEVPVKLPKPQVDPQVRAAAQNAVLEALGKLEQEMELGHGKASAGAAGALRQALKEFGRFVDGKLESRAHAALSAAGELEGWQRWRADQLREELVAKAEGLLKRPDGQAMGGRKMQEALRALREQWKQTDQGGIPNHGLWKRFDEACNEAHKVVEAWLEKIKAETAEHKSQRIALIEEVNAWAAENRTARDDDWKGFSRILHQFANRWRDSGHLSEKAFTELLPLWKAALANAAAPLEALQAQSIAMRNSMIEEAKALGAAPTLRIDAVKSLQQRWQAQAHVVPLDRRQEQKMWDAFRKPIDEAFNRKSAEREKAEAALGERDRAVLDAAKALEAANHAGDAKLIRAAMDALDAAMKGQAQAQAHVKSMGDKDESAKAASEFQHSGAEVPADEVTTADSTKVVNEEGGEAGQPQTAPQIAKTAPRPVVAVRGDDRPGMKKESQVAPNDRHAKRGERRDAPHSARDNKSFGGPGREDRDRVFSRPDVPRLGDAAFRAQRDALEHAQLALRKLAAQAHGEALTHLMAAWERREAALVPTVQELGSKLTAAHRTTWVQAIATGDSNLKGTNPSEALLRLEMAAEVPTPADLLNQRRALQLQLLTRRNEPGPTQTWIQDVSTALSGPYGVQESRRLQNVLKVLLKK